NLPRAVQNELQPTAPGFRPAAGAGINTDAYANSLLAHASWLVAKSRSDFALPLRKGLERKAHRICIGKSEDLERKARFLALCAKNALKF
ncbi:MAG: hypothetical protein LBK13_08995, partial [Spirochaetales bacterium]|nr:hypothetical protein [Spirochaetales bacterium]